MNALISARIMETISTLHLVHESCIQESTVLVRHLVEVFHSGHKLLICGNGGSAADSQHLAAEFVSSFSHGLSRRSLPAIALSVDTSIISAISNDFNFDIVFSRQVEGLGNPGDALLVISTSGESKNCIFAIETAKKLSMKTMALTRKDSSIYNMVDFPIGVPSQNTQHIQEAHIVLYHCIAEIVEDSFMKTGSN